MTLSTNALAASLATTRSLLTTGTRTPAPANTPSDRTLAGAKFLRLANERSAPSLRAASTLKARQALLGGNKDTAPSARSAEATPGLLPTTEPTKIVGDVDGDGQVTMKDPLALLDYLFNGAAKPAGIDAADVNGDGKVNLVDAISLMEDMPS